MVNVTDQKKEKYIVRLYILNTLHIYMIIIGRYLFFVSWNSKPNWAKMAFVPDA